MFKKLPMQIQVRTWGAPVLHFNKNLAITNTAYRPRFSLSWYQSVWITNRVNFKIKNTDKKALTNCIATKYPTMLAASLQLHKTLRWMVRFRQQARTYQSVNVDGRSPKVSSDGIQNLCSFVSYLPITSSLVSLLKLIVSSSIKIIKRSWFKN